MSAINEFCDVKDDVVKAFRKSITEVPDPNLNGSVLATQRCIDELIKMVIVPKTFATAKANIVMSTGM